MRFKNFTNGESTFPRPPLALLRRQRSLFHDRRTPIDRREPDSRPSPNSETRASSRSLALAPRYSSQKVSSYRDTKRLPTSRPVHHRLPAPTYREDFETPTRADTSPFRKSWHAPLPRDAVSAHFLTAVLPYLNKITIFLSLVPCLFPITLPPSCLPSFSQSLRRSGSLFPYTVRRASTRAYRQKTVPLPAYRYLRSS